VTSVAVRTAEVDADEIGGGVGVGRVGRGVGWSVGCLDGLRVGRGVEGVGRDVAGRLVGRGVGGGVGRLVGSEVGRLVGGCGRACVIVIMDSNIVIGRSVGSTGCAVGFGDGTGV